MVCSAVERGQRPARSSPTTDRTRSTPTARSGGGSRSGPRPRRRAARPLLRDDSVRWTGTRTMLLDVGPLADRRDPSIVSDLDEAGWIERFSAQDPSLAPSGHSLLQAQLGARDSEDLDAALARIE